MKSKDARLELAELIELVKLEIIRYQQKHQGEPALFNIAEVTLEASVGTTFGADGKASLFVLNIGTSVSQVASHKVALKLNIVTPPENEPRISLRPLLDLTNFTGPDENGQIGTVVDGDITGLGPDGVKIVRGRRNPSIKKAVRPFGTNLGGVRTPKPRKDSRFPPDLHEPPGSNE
jgi:hypothetical protein